MPDPLPSDIVARLRSDSTAALAASLILAGRFPTSFRGRLGHSARAASLRPAYRLTAARTGRRRNLNRQPSQTKPCSR
jgi:hypothetical protein